MGHCARQWPGCSLGCLKQVPPHLSGFFKPCAFLEGAARDGRKLSGGRAAASRL
jgi:hypothetical protein